MSASPLVPETRYEMMVNQVNDCRMDEFSSGVYIIACMVIISHTVVPTTGLDNTAKGVCFKPSAKSA